MENAGTGQPHSPFRSAFLSYCRGDRPVASIIVSILQAVDVRVLWDGAIKAGLLWEDVLLDWLDEAEMAFVLWSENAANSDWVRTELDLLASKRSSRLVPVLLDDTQLPKSLCEREWVEMGSMIQSWVTRREHDGVLMWVNPVLMRSASRMVAASFAQHLTPRYKGPKTIVEVERGQVETVLFYGIEGEKSYPFQDLTNLEAWYKQRFGSLPPPRKA